MNNKELLLSFVKYFEERNLLPDLAYNTEAKINQFLSSVVTEIHAYAPKPMRYFFVPFMYTTVGSSGRANLLLESNEMPSKDYMTASAIMYIAKEYCRPDYDFTVDIIGWIELTEEDYSNFIKK